MKTVLIVMMCLLLSGCGNDMIEPTETIIGNDAGLSNKEIFSEKAKLIADYEDNNECLTQTEINIHSYNTRVMWDNLMEEIIGQFNFEMSDEALEKLFDEQNTWEKEREKLTEEAGAEFEGGSIQPTIENGYYSEMTQERCYELIDLLK